MIFLDYWFSYILIGYQKWGEKSSAHFYALCVLSILMGCNLLTICSFILSKSFLDSKKFETLLILLTGITIALNALIFLETKDI